MRKQNYSNPRITDYADYFRAKEETKSAWDQYLISMNKKITNWMIVILFITLIAHVFIK